MSIDGYHMGTTAIFEHKQPWQVTPTNLKTKMLGRVQV